MLKSSLILLLCLLGIASALHPTLNSTFNPTLKKNYFYVNSNNHFPYELYQTRNGIVTFSIENLNQTTYISQYLLIDLPSRDAKPILTDIVKACELVTPTYQYLHSHVQTDSLVYFCYANNSLLLIDQSSYTVEKVIPFNISGAWPVVKLSTDGMSIAVLLMGDLLTTTPKASMLVKVDMQVRQVTAEIWLNKDFGVGEAVVAYASNKKAAYIATNRIQAKALTTTIYSLITIGNSYQITPITTFSADMTPVKIVTKLFVVGNWVVANNGQDIYWINQDGIYTTVPKVYWKSITNNQQGLFHLAMTAQYGSNDIYIQMGVESVFKYSALENTIHYKQIGGYGGIQIAYGNQTSGDLMFSTDYIGVIFSIIDLQTLQPIYTTVSGFTDLMLTNTTYAVVQAHNYADYNLYIFDLKNDTLLAKIPVPQMFHHNKEQHIISFFNSSGYQGCNLTHIDLTTGKSWTTLNISGTSMICDLHITSLRITENGNPEFVVPVLQDFMIFTESYGNIDFQTRTSPWLTDALALNFDFDNLTFYYFDSDPSGNTTNITYYSFDPKTQKVQYQSSNLIRNFSASYTGYYFVNSSSTVALNNHTVTVINGLGQSASIYHYQADWNSASSFEDAAGSQHIVLTKAGMSFQRGSAPGLLSNGNIVSLPGLRNDSVRAQAAGPRSYWIADALYSSVGLVRFYDVARSRASEEKILISI